MKEIVNGMTNEMKLEFDSRSANEAFARVTVASFMTQLNPTLEEVSDVKTGHCIWKSPIGAWESQM